MTLNINFASIIIIIIIILFYFILLILSFDCVGGKQICWPC